MDCAYIPSGKIRVDSKCSYIAQWLRQPWTYVPRDSSVPIYSYPLWMEMS